jgi:hypothetical protein
MEEEHLGIGKTEALPNFGELFVWFDMHDICHKTYYDNLNQQYKSNNLMVQ